jgi:hypothetical protein
MIKNRVMFFTLVLIASVTLACSSGGGSTDSQADITSLQKYTQQATTKLDAFEARHKEMMRQIGSSLRQRPNKNYQYNKETVLGHTAKMRSELDNMQQDFRAMTIPKSAESFAGNIMQLIVNELVFIDKLEKAFQSENQEISEGAWPGLTANGQLILYQKGRLVGEMQRVSSATQNANAREK